MADIWSDAGSGTGGGCSRRRWRRWRHWCWHRVRGTTAVCGWLIGGLQSRCLMGSWSSAGITSTSSSLRRLWPDVLSGRFRVFLQLHKVHGTFFGWLSISTASIGGLSYPKNIMSQNVAGCQWQSSHTKFLWHLVTPAQSVCAHSLQDWHWIHVSELSVHNSVQYKQAVYVSWPPPDVEPAKQTETATKFKDYLIHWLETI